MKWHSALLAFLTGTLFLMTSAALAETSLSELDGDWVVNYSDNKLGRITGEAHIDAAAGTAEVTYKDPETGEARAFRSKSLNLDGDTLTIVLEGRSPGKRYDGLDAPDIDYKIENGDGAVTVRWGSNSASLPLKSIPQTDRDQVTLELKVTDQILGGAWRYRSHWFLGHADDGSGRSGDIDVDAAGTAWTTGVESWHRPSPIVYGVIPLENQLAFRMTSKGTGDAYYPYPFGASPDFKVKTRYLFVFGKNLPRKHGRKLSIESVDPGIEYLESARMSDSGALHKGKLLTDGFRKLRERLAARGGRSAALIDEAIADLDAIVLRADLKQAVVPGINTFTVNGQEVAWLLQFGDNTAQMRVVRQANREGDRFEPTSIAFAGELIKIEIETTQPLPVDSIPVIVGVDDKPLLLGDGDGIPAGRDPNNPRIYRTDFIRLDMREFPGSAIDMDAGNGYAVMGVKRGARVQAAIGRPGLISVPPGMAQAAVYGAPGDPDVGGDWSGWLKSAAACTKFSAVATDKDEAYEFSKLLLNTGNYGPLPVPGWLEEKVSVGQLAAMLLLRDTFKRLLKSNIQALSKLTSDEDILAFRKQVEPMVRSGKSVLSTIDVEDVGGGQTQFLWSFEKDILASLNDGKIDDIERWAITVTRQALAKYQEVMQASLDRAEDIKDCEVEDLVRLTAFDFHAVAVIAKTKVMLQPDPTLQFWVPDYRARGWIDTVEFLGQQLNIQERLGQADRREATAAVLLATLPVAIVGAFVESTAIVMVTYILDIFDIVTGVSGEVHEKWKSDREVEFAKGAADVIGLDRLERAEAEHISWTTVFTHIGIYHALPAIGGVYVPEVFGEAFREAVNFIKLRKAIRGRAAMMAISKIDPLKAGAAPAKNIDALVADALETSRQAQSGARAGTSLDELADAVDQPRAQGPPQRGVRFDDLPDAPANVVSDIAALLDHAQGAKTTSQLDSQALEAAQEVVAKAQQSVARHESWGLRPATLRRPDVRSLIETAEPRLAQQFASGERQLIARDVLESEPGLTIDRFEARVEELLRRKDEPLGPDYYLQASPNDVATITALRDAGWRTRTSIDGEELVIRDPHGHVGKLGRSWDPETHTYTMNYAFREAHSTFEADVIPVAGPIDGWIQAGLRRPLSERGTPSMQFFTMQIMNHLNIPYGSADGIREAVMSTIINQRTIAQISWFKRTYYPNTPWSAIPDEEMTRAIMLTHSGRYGAENLAVAGYRVRRARLNIGDDVDADGLLMESGFVPEGGETFEAFIARHGIEEDTPVWEWFDITFDVEPWR
jgi:hypothetical protein